MSSALSVLRVPAFGRLAAAYTLNEFGDWFGAVALAVLVYDRTGDPLATTALFIASKFVPAFLAPALTARIDQVATRRSLPALYVAEAAAFLALGLTADAFLLPLVLALALVDGTLALTGRGLTRAAVARVLPGSAELRAGNALMNVGFAIAGTAGPALAGLVVAATNVRTALLIDAGSFLAIAALLATASDLPDAHVREQSWGERVRAGLTYVRGHRRVRALLTAESAAFVFFAAVAPIEVLYAKQSLGAGDAGFGLLMTAWGGGVVLGSLVFGASAKRSLIGLIGLSTVAVALSYVGLAGAQSLTLACAISVFGGLGNGIQWIAVVTAIQEVTEPDYQARVVGLLESIAAAMLGVGFALGGLVAAAWSPRAAFLVAGAGIGVVVLGGGVAAIRIRASAPAAAEPHAPLLDPPPPATALARAEAGAPGASDR